MQMQGERSIRASRDVVWKALNTPEVLKACIPGCEELERTSDTTFEGKVKQKVGPVNARFNVNVSLSDVVEAESYRITGEGKGGAAGFAKGGAAVALKDEGDGTLLTYDAEAKVGGKLAQLGSRIIDGYAKKMADEFFDRFKKELEPADAAPPDDEEGARDSKAQDSKAQASKAKNTSEKTEPKKRAGAAGGDSPRKSAQSSAKSSTQSSAKSSTRSSTKSSTQSSTRSGNAPAGTEGGGSATTAGPSWLDRLKAWFRRVFG